jgi:hypothetical protein
MLLAAAAAIVGSVIILNDPTFQGLVISPMAGETTTATNLWKAQYFIDAIINKNAV